MRNSVGQTIWFLQLNCKGKKDKGRNLSIRRVLRDTSWLLCGVIWTPNQIGQRFKKRKEDRNLNSDCWIFTLWNYLNMIMALWWCFFIKVLILEIYTKIFTSVVIWYLEFASEGWGNSVVGGYRSRVTTEVRWWILGDSLYHPLYFYIYICWRLCIISHFKSNPSQVNRKDSK